MPEIQTGNSIINNTQTGTPLNYYGNNYNMQPQQQTVSVSTPSSSQIYQYPQTSLYNDPNKQAASGVNIYIYNPTGIGGQPAAVAPVSAPVTAPASQLYANNPQETPVANTPISSETEKNNSTNNKKTKKVVDLTDDYIKTLESYLRSPDATVRNTGIKELIKRFEEDNTRFEDEALTALLNIALQDPDANNRLLAMSPISGGQAHGDENTIEMLKNLQSSDKIYGQEAKMANSALIKASQTMKTIPDNSPQKEEKKEDEDENKNEDEN